ncbi:Immunity protein 70 [Clostridium cavendishii DSM 21758]|uniref:Immunity protein 70 n=1 Tax=Clostridium cavendishii DSM 21758 TaxID=1121302 RepID=A0A1M6QFG6_9CLOT|nr:Imm70 family immunity protein [Clostridium cavendishii]SHK18951.1 Immunity protein 70 [Clostridium cavendishii DSM 21758]
MNVGLFYSEIWWEIGSPDLLHSLFSTISYNLEQNGWGSKYPYLLKKLYNSKIERGETEMALNEIMDIKEKFLSLSAQNMIWDIEETTKKVPLNYNYHLKAQNLAECFISVGEKNIIEKLIETLEWCTKKNFTLEIRREDDIYR